MLDRKIVIIIIFLIVAGGAIGFFFSKESPEKVKPNDDTQAEKTTTKNVKEKNKTKEKVQASLFKTPVIEDSDMGTNLQFFVKLNKDKHFELYRDAYGTNENIKQKATGKYETDGGKLDLHVETIEEKIYDNLDQFQKNVISEMERSSIHDDPPTINHPISYHLYKDDNQTSFISNNELVKMDETRNLPEWKEKEIEIVDYQDLKKEDRERITIRLVFKRWDTDEFETAMHHSPVDAHLQIVNNSDYHVKIKPSRVSLELIDDHGYLSGNYSGSDYVLTVPRGETEMIEDLYTDENFEFFSRVELIYVLYSDGTSGGARYDMLGEQVTNPIFIDE